MRISAERVDRTLSRSLMGVASRRLCHERGKRTQMAGEKFNIHQIIDNAPLKEIHIRILLIGLSLALVNGLARMTMIPVIPALLGAIAIIFARPSSQPAAATALSVHHLTP
jgi:hypothetical protein